VKKFLFLNLVLLLIFACGSMLPLSETTLDRAHFIYKDDQILVASVPRQLANVGYGFDVLLVNKSDGSLMFEYDDYGFVIHTNDLERYTEKEMSKGYFPMDLMPGESINLIFVAPEDVTPDCAVDYSIFILNGKEYRMEKS